MRKYWLFVENRGKMRCVVYLKNPILLLYLSLGSFLLSLLLGHAIHLFSDFNQKLLIKLSFSQSSSLIPSTGQENPTFRLSLRKQKIKRLKTHVFYNRKVVRNDFQW